MCSMCMPELGISSWGVGGMGIEQIHQNGMSGVFADFGLSTKGLTLKALQNINQTYAQR